MVRANVRKSIWKRLYTSRFVRLLIGRTSEPVLATNVQPNDERDGVQATSLRQRVDNRRQDQDRDIE